MKLNNALHYSQSQTAIHKNFLALYQCDLPGTPPLASPSATGQYTLVYPFIVTYHISCNTTLFVLVPTQHIMHAALFIDEILRNIFHFCRDDGLAILVAVAGSCKAWKDPALDYIWSRLFSVIPLLQLIPSLELDNGIYTLHRSVDMGEMTLFRSYARRVKHIAHKEHVRVNSDVLSLLCDEHSFPSTLGVLQHLRSVQLSASNYSALQKSFALSPQLERLDCDLGFSSRKSLSIDAVCDYFDHVTAVSSQLQTISIRGRGSPRLNKAVSSLSHLSTVSLRMGSSLLPETLKAVIAFPSLLVLELHAGHLELDGLLETGCSMSLPALQKLSVRAHSPIIMFLLERLQPGTIHSVRLELENDSLTSKSWQDITDLLTAKGGNSLHSLTIEHHVEVSVDDDENSGSTTLNTDGGVSDSDYTSLSSLRSLTRLRHLALDMALPPRIHDKDVDNLATWWPDIEHLNLGSISTGASCTASTATLSSLITFGRRLPKLRQLILPLTIKNIPEISSINKLEDYPAMEHLYIACASPHDAPKLANFLNRVFPRLGVIDGPVHADGGWEITQKELDVLRAVCTQH